MLDCIHIFLRGEYVFRRKCGHTTKMKTENGVGDTEIEFQLSN